MKEHQQLTWEQECSLPEIHIEFSTTLLKNGKYCVYQCTRVRNFHTPNVEIDLSLYHLNRKGMKFLGFRKVTPRTTRFYYSPQSILNS